MAGSEFDKSSSSSRASTRQWMSCFAPIRVIPSLLPAGFGSYNAPMSQFRPIAPDSSTGIRQSGVALTPLSLKRFIVTGSIGFSIASLCVFATVIWQSWMYRHLGVSAAFLVWIVLFILLGGRALSPLVVDTRRRSRFYVVFGVAFFAYGISWMAAYFTFKNAVGEWLGSFVGSVCMALVFAAWFGVLRSAPLFAALLFVANSIAYFLGSLLFYSFSHDVGLLVWGPFYGLCLGAGLGGVLYIAQCERASGTQSER